MGLDMYLNKKIYVGANYEHRKVAGVIDLTEGEDPVRPIKIDFNKVSEIVEQVCYWRKANAIHNWFIENCADGEDDCRTMSVWRSQLEDLRNVCQKVLDECILVKGEIANGQRMNSASGLMEDILEEGEYIENPEIAEELLPTHSGFFFGSTNYDQWYISDLEHTVKVLTEELDKPDDGSYYEYHASW